MNIVALGKIVVLAKFVFLMCNVLLLALVLFVMLLVVFRKQVLVWFLKRAVRKETMRLSRVAASTMSVRVVLPKKKEQD